MKVPKALMTADPRVLARLRPDWEEAKRQYAEYGEWYEAVFEKAVLISEIDLPPVWNTYRYEDAKARLQKTNAMPPIMLYYNELTGKYGIEDGIHRTHAAEDLDYTHVPAVATYKRTYPP